MSVSSFSLFRWYGEERPLTNLHVRLLAELIRPSFYSDLLFTFYKYYSKNFLFLQTGSIGLEPILLASTVLETAVLPIKLTPNIAEHNLRSRVIHPGVPRILTLTGTEWWTSMGNLIPARALLDTYLALFKDIKLDLLCILFYFAGQVTRSRLARWGSNPRHPD